MMIAPTQDAESSDPYMRPSFGLKNRLARLLWGVVWLLMFRPSPQPLYAWRCLLLRLFGAKIGKSNHIYPGAKIWAPWLLQTEDMVTLADGTEVYNPGGIYLGHHTIISQGAYLCGATHDYNSPNFDYVMKPIRTGAYVWICARAIVLPGVHCGTGSVLGAGSVASRSMDAWSVYAGNPAKMVRARQKFHTE